MPCIWNDWLPHDLAEEIKYEEPKRFRRIIDRVCDSWHSMSDACGTDDERVQSSLAYVPLVKGMLDAKVEPGIQHMQRLAETLYDIVLHTEADLTAQARWSAVLHRILRTHGKKMDITIEWKPLYSMLRRHHLVMSSNYEGAGVMEARRQALVHLLHQSRRFFPPNTAQEIWDYFKPALKDPHSTEAFESIGWVCMMLPTQEALKGQGLWSEWMKEWMQIWGQRVHNQTWQSLWFSLMARLAKHDVHGVIDWHGIIRLMVNRFLWAFHVPLGSASASPPFNAGAPATIEALFAMICSQDRHLLQKH
jgi:proteasome activator subunit 4